MNLLNQHKKKPRGDSRSRRLAPMLALPVTLILAGWLLLSTAVAVSARPLAQTPEEGQQLFQQMCQACHTIGGGKLVGPDLKDVTQRRDSAWLQAFISTPDKLIAQGDPIATQLLKENNNVAMPNLGLSEAQVAALLVYLSDPAAAPAAAAVVLSGGDVQRGQALFEGRMALQNGGTNCIACHTVSGYTPLGGGALGPDLTQVVGRLGQPGLSSALQSLPFPTMTGIFSTRPLSPQEQADLFAFLDQANQQAAAVWQPAQTAWFWMIGGAGALVLFGLMLIFWPRQRQNRPEKLRRMALRRPAR